MLTGASNVPLQRSQSTPQWPPLKYQGWVRPQRFSLLDPSSWPWLSWGQSVSHLACAPSVQEPIRQRKTNTCKIAHIVKICLTCPHNYITYLFYAGCVFKQNETKASWPACLLVHFDGAVCHFAKFREVVFKILLACVPAETANKHFPEHRRRDTVSSSSCRHPPTNKLHTVVVVGRTRGVDIQAVPKHLVTQ